MPYKDKEIAKAYKIKYRQEHKEEAKAYQKKHGREYARRIKLEVLSYYSNGMPICAYCGIDDVDILCIDHINNDGAEHRGTGGVPRKAGLPFYYWLKRNSYPQGYQVLCHNCNWKKRIQELIKELEGNEPKE